MRHFRRSPWEVIGLIIVVAILLQIAIAELKAIWPYLGLSVLVVGVVYFFYQRAQRF